MLLPFFTALRDAKVPVSMKEWLHLMEAMDKDVAGRKVDDFYHLSRAVLVKDEKHYDRFDQVFGKVFAGIESVGAGEEPAPFPAQAIGSHQLGGQACHHAAAAGVYCAAFCMATISCK